MKKLFAIVLVLLLFMGFSVPAEAATHWFSYTILDDGTAQITFYFGNENNIEIPSRLDGIK
ncbi:MAG: hypothetical protein IK019_03455, partial [Clostridia bacterium]|nr:hypothetical protein [Clostridia bacterium]